MGKHIVLPALAVAGGLAALALRLWQLRAAYDPATQLFRSGALPTRLLLVLLLLLALCAAGALSGKIFLSGAEKRREGPQTGEGPEKKKEPLSGAEQTEKEEEEREP